MQYSNGCIIISFNFPQNVLGSRGAPLPTPLRGVQRSPDPTDGRIAKMCGGGGGGGGGVGGSAFSLGHQRKNPKKVENLNRRMQPA